MADVNSQTALTKKPLAKTFGLILVIVVIVFAGLLIYRLVSGKSLGLRSLVMNPLYAAANVGRAIFGSASVKDSTIEEFHNIVFLHHSTGNNLIQQGGVRKIMQEAGYNFWDHGFNMQGLRGPDGKKTGYHYQIPNDNTDPIGFHEIFTQPEYPLPLNAYSGLLQHDVIIFKSCFTPTNQIISDSQLDQYKAWYLDIRAETEQHPEKLFIALTPPPLNPAETNPAEAARARAFAEWLMSDEYLARHYNLVVFDFYSLLAVNDPASPEHNMLREDYRNGSDSHPNEAANQIIGPIFAEFVIQTIEAYQATLR